MKSPFPGMDPYLEREWRDVHTALTIYLRDALLEQLPASLVARIEGEVIVDVDRPATAGNRLRPNLQVVDSWEPSTAGKVGTRSAVVAMPTMIFAVEEEIQHRIEILDPQGRTVVTVIEILSPTNRSLGAGREAYLTKRRHYLEGGINVVEIDLVRAGEHTIAIPLDQIPSEQRAPWYVCAYRAFPRQWELYSMPLEKPLPVVRIPLRQMDADAVIALQPLIEMVYARGRYETLDYTQPLRPPLAPAQAAWVRERLSAAGIVPHSEDLP